MTLRTFKITTRVPNTREPFVDWYHCETEAIAREAYAIEAEQAGIPATATMEIEEIHGMRHMPVSQLIRDLSQIVEGGPL